VKPGAQLKHRRKRLRGTLKADGTIELRSGRRVPFASDQWRPWEGHAQSARERTETQLRSLGHEAGSLAIAAVKVQQRQPSGRFGRGMRRRAFKRAWRSHRRR
jgi:hypothetical protein